MKKRYWMLLTVLVCLGAGVLLGPRLLMQAATKKPVNAGTFVTRPVAAPDLSQQVNLALQESSQPQPVSSSQSAGNPEEVKVPGQALPAEPLQESHSQAQTWSLGTNTQPQTPTGATPVPSVPVISPTGSSALSTAVSDNSSLRHSPSQGRSTGKFKLQLSENELASMIYNGLYAGTAPEYRSSIQGVSVQLQGGRGKITVALLPKYLPEHFLRNLPGVTRETPTIYLGGEVGLSVSGNAVVPEIYSLSLGSLRIPAPFIKAMVKYQVQQQVSQMTRLASGQQAILDAVEVDQGAVLIRGHVE